MEDVSSFVQAVQDRSIYAAAGYAVVLLLFVLRAWKPVYWDRIPDHYQWIPAVLISGLGSFVVSWREGARWEVAIGVGVMAAATGGPMAIGFHRIPKDLKKRKAQVVSELPTEERLVQNAPQEDAE